MACPAGRLEAGTTFGPSGSSARACSTALGCPENLINRNPLDANNAFDAVAVLTGHDVLGSHDGDNLPNVSVLAGHAAPAGAL
jgi:hypothetical protein